MNPIVQQLQLESARRFGGLGASPVATSPNPSSSGPIQPTAASNPLSTQVAAPTPNAPQNPLQGAMGAMQKAQPGESEMIVKGLLDRLKQYPVPGGAPTA